MKDSSLEYADTGRRVLIADMPDAEVRQTLDLIARGEITVIDDGDSGTLDDLRERCLIELVARGLA